jgi:hypothetical protein
MDQADIPLDHHEFLGHCGQCEGAAIDCLELGIDEDSAFLAGY